MKVIFQLYCDLYLLDIINLTLHNCFLVLCDHGLYVVNIWKYSPANAPVVWHLSLPLMNNNKTEAAIFPMQSMLPEDFPFFFTEKKMTVKT